MTIIKENKERKKTSHTQIKNFINSIERFVTFLPNLEFISSPSNLQRFKNPRFSFFTCLFWIYPKMLDALTCRQSVLVRKQKLVHFSMHEPRCLVLSISLLCKKKANFESICGFKSFLFINLLFLSFLSTLISFGEEALNSMVYSKSVVQQKGVHSPACQLKD